MTRKPKKPPAFPAPAYGRKRWRDPLVTPRSERAKAAIERLAVTPFRLSKLLGLDADTVYRWFGMGQRQTEPQSWLLRVLWLFERRPELMQELTEYYDPEAWRPPKFVIEATRKARREEKERLLSERLAAETAAATDSPPPDPLPDPPALPPSQPRPPQPAAAPVSPPPPPALSPAAPPPHPPQPERPRLPWHRLT